MDGTQIDLSSHANIFGSTKRNEWDGTKIDLNSYANICLQEQKMNGNQIESFFLLPYNYLLFKNQANQS